MYLKNRFFQRFTSSSFFHYFNNILSLNFLLSNDQITSFDFHGLLSNSVFLSIEHIKVQELGFLPEYFHHEK